MRTACTLTIAALCAGTAIAQPDIHAGDIALGILDNQLAFGDGSFNPDTLEPIFDACLFGVQLDANARASDPGFDSQTGAFTPGREIGWNYRAALRRWDGTDFSTIPDEYVIITFGPLVGPATPTSDTNIPGFGLTVGGSGEYHNHFTFRLLQTGNQPANDPDSLGTYLLELEFWMDPADAMMSEPLLLVLNNGDSDTSFNDALAYAEQNLAWCSMVVADCPADVNGDGMATPADFTAWLGCFQNPASQPFCDRADVNDSGSIEPADFTAWLAAFNTGCP